MPNCDPVECARWRQLFLFHAGRSFAISFRPVPGTYPDRLQRAAQLQPGPDGRKDEVKTADEKVRLPQRALQFGNQWSSHPPRKPARRSPFTI